MDYAGFRMISYEIKQENGARDRNRTGTPVIHEAADFKSDVSTYFTTRALAHYCGTKMPRQLSSTGHCVPEILEARSGVEPD